MRPLAQRCAGCGLKVPGGTAGCQSMMDELLALHFNDTTYFAAHRLFVDTYCLQHPDEYCRSFKSLAAHLMHLCWSLEHRGNAALPNETIRRTHGWRMHRFTRSLVNGSLSPSRNQLALGNDVPIRVGS